MSSFPRRTPNLESDFRSGVACSPRWLKKSVAVAALSQMTSQRAVAVLCSHDSGLNRLRLWLLRSGYGRGRDDGGAASASPLLETTPRILLKTSVAGRVMSPKATMPWQRCERSCDSWRTRRRTFHCRSIFRELSFRRRSGKPSGRFRRATRAPTASLRQPWARPLPSGRSPRPAGETRWPSSCLATASSARTAR